MRNELLAIQRLTILGVTRMVVYADFEDLGIGYVLTLGKSGWLKPVTDNNYTTLPRGIFYAETSKELGSVNLVLQAISKMSYTAYNKDIVVLDLGVLIKQLSEGYSLQPSYLDESQFYTGDIDGIAVMNFVTIDSNANAYTERERNMVKGFLLNMARNGKGVYLGCATMNKSSIAAEWGVSFVAELDKTDFTYNRLPLKE